MAAPGTRPDETAAGTINVRAVGLRLWRALTDRTSLITTAFKLVRVILMVLALKLVAAIFKDWYRDVDAGAPGKLPRLATFVWLFFLVDVLINAVITVTILVLVDDVVARTSLLDYIIGTFISLKLSLSAAGTLANPRLFDYAADGLLLISAAERMITTIIIVNTFIPYYLLVRDILYIV